MESDILYLNVPRCKSHIAPPPLFLRKGYPVPLRDGLGLVIDLIGMRIQR